MSGSKLEMRCSESEHHGVCEQHTGSVKLRLLVSVVHVCGIHLSEFVARIQTIGFQNVVEIAELVFASP